jgi:hypothetical protein
MQRSVRRPLRPVLAGFAAVAVAAACAACGGGSGGPGKVSLTAAAANPCLLVSWAEARAILGSGTTRPTRDKGQCLFDSGSAPLGHVVSVDIGPGPFSSVAADGLITSPAPTAAGHGTLCGKTQSGAVGPTSLVGPFGPSHGLLIIGPSCAVNAKFARQIYLHLS